MQNKSLTFFSCATQHYMHFIPIYTYFACQTNPGAKFEFIVDDPQECRNRLDKAFNWLQENEVEISASQR